MKYSQTIFLGLLGVLFTFSSCKVVHPQRVAYLLPVSRAMSPDWSALFEQNPRIDSFKILHTGSVQVPVKGMLNSEKLTEGNPYGKLMWVDVFAFLFHHTEKGWFMIDTGLDSSFQNKGNISGLLAGNYIKASRQDQGQNIAAHLSRENKQIEGIFLTHLHGDHTAGLPEIDASIPKYVGKGEAHLHYPLLYQSNHLNAQDTPL